MTRKTKKKKIITDYRKKMSRLNSPASTSVSNPIHVSEASVAKPQKETRKSVKNAYEIVDHESFAKQRALIARDIKKTLILSMLAIGSLIVISLVPVN